MSYLRLVSSRFNLLVGIGFLAFLTFVLLAYLESQLPSAEYSEFAAFWSFIMGIIMGFTYPLETNGLAVNDPNNIDNTVVREFSAIKSVVFFLASILTLTSWLYIPSVFKGDWLYLVNFLLVLVSFAMIYASRSRLLTSKKYFRYAQFLTLEGLLRIILSAILIMILGASGINAAFSICLAAIISAILISKSASLKLFKIFSWNVKFEINVFKLVFANLVIIFILNIGPSFIQALDQSGELAGKELNALTISRIPVFLGPVILSVLIPKFLENQNLKKSKETDLLMQALIAISLVAISWILVFTFFGKIFVETLFGPNSVSTSTNMVILGTMTGFYLILTVLQAYFVALQLSGYVSLSLGIGGTAMILCLLLPLPIVFRTEFAGMTGMGIPILCLLWITKKQQKLNLASNSNIF